MLKRSISIATLVFTSLILGVVVERATQTSSADSKTLPHLWVFPNGVHHAETARPNPVYDVEYKNNHYVLPPVPAGDGHIIEIPLHAPGLIKKVTMYHKEGPGCNWTYECPDGTKCPDPYRNTVDHLGTTAQYHARSNSGENCALFFQIDF